MLNIERAFRNVCDRIAQQNVPVEGFVVMDQNAAVLFQKRWTQDIPRDIYLNTKSFTGLAVGISVSMGILSLEDSVADCFKDELPPNASPALETMKPKHLLTMSSGFDRGAFDVPGSQKRCRISGLSAISAVPGSASDSRHPILLFNGRFCFCGPHVRKSHGNRPAAVFI